MENYNKGSFKRILSWLLVVAMLIGATPITAFAEGGLEVSTPEPPSQVGEAAPPEESDVSNDARDAVHAFVGVQTGVET